MAESLAEPSGHRTARRSGRLGPLALRKRTHLTQCSASDMQAGLPCSVQHLVAIDRHKRNVVAIGKFAGL